MALQAELSEDEMAALAVLLEKLDWGGVKAHHRDLHGGVSVVQPPEGYVPRSDWLSATWRPMAAIVEQATRHDTLLSQGVWNALHSAVTMTCVELSVMRTVRDRGVEILLIPRLSNDEHYPNEPLHGPGSVTYGHEPLEWTLSRIWNKELAEGDFTLPVHIGYRHANGARGPEIAMHFLCVLHGEYVGDGSFYSVDDLPYERMIPHHRLLADRARNWLRFYLQYNRKQRS